MKIKADRLPVILRNKERAISLQGPPSFQPGRYMLRGGSEWGSEHTDAEGRPSFLTGILLGHGELADQYMFSFRNPNCRASSPGWAALTWT